MPSSAEEGRGRAHSNKYVLFLHQWDTQRRLKKPTAGPPEGYQHPHAIHGQLVTRLGKGTPPPEKQEQDLKWHHRRYHPDMSFHRNDDILCQKRPSTAPEHLLLDETHRRVLRQRNASNFKSSMQGAGVLLTAEPAQHRPKRASGVANPGHGLKAEMLQALTFEPEKRQAQQQMSRSLWSMVHGQRLPGVALMTAADLEARPKLNVDRPVTPALQSCSAEERRTAFQASLTAYAQNKLVGDLGTLRLHAGLRTLA